MYALKIRPVLLKTFPSASVNVLHMILQTFYVSRRIGLITTWDKCCQISFIALIISCIYNSHHNRIINVC